MDVLKMIFYVPRLHRLSEATRLLFSPKRINGVSVTANHMAKMYLAKICAAAVLVTGLNATASLTYSTSSGATVGATPVAVDAQASFTFGEGYLTILVQNLQTDMVSSGQAISGITFNLAGITGASTFGTDFTGETTTIASDGSYTTPVSTTLTRWAVDPSAGSIELTALSGGKTSEMIAGPPGYDTVNNGFKQFDPYVFESASFTLSNLNFTANSTVSDVSFTFGTPSGTVCGVPNQYSSVPEPSTVFAGALLLLPFGVSVIRIVRKHRAV